MLRKPQKLMPVSRDIFTLRPATEKDMNAVFLMGQDAWGDKATESEYLAMCRNSVKYQSGNWSILTLADGRPLSSAISYALSESAPDLWIGIGSLSTVINERSKGHALICLSMLVESYDRQQSAKKFMLFSDVPSGIYASAGFQDARTVGYDEQASNLMIKTSNNEKPEADQLLRRYVHYF